MRLKSLLERRPDPKGSFYSRQHVIPSELQPVTVMNHVPEAAVRGQFLCQRLVEQSRQAALHGNANGFDQPHVPLRARWDFHRMIPAEPVEDVLNPIVEVGQEQPRSGQFTSRWLAPCNVLLK